MADVNVNFVHPTDGRMLTVNLDDMIRTLQFDLDITNPDSAANGDAQDWFLSKKTSDLFPCDRTNLPDPTKSKFTIQPEIKKKFQVQ